MGDQVQKVPTTDPVEEITSQDVVKISTSSIELLMNRAKGNLVFGDFVGSGSSPTTDPGMEEKTFGKISTSQDTELLMNRAKGEVVFGNGSGSSPTSDPGMEEKTFGKISTSQDSQDFPELKICSGNLDHVGEEDEHEDEEEDPGVENVGEEDEHEDEEEDPGVEDNGGEEGENTLFNRRANDAETQAWMDSFGAIPQWELRR